MPVYKDKDRNTWYCQFYYKDWQGQRKRKTKRGFARQKDAKEYERMFLDRLKANPEMLFSSLVDLYIADMKNRLKEHTIMCKQKVINSKILPYFGNMKICDIKPTTVRAWQNEISAPNLANTYLRTIHANLSAIMNYAVKYYGLPENPCIKAGAIGSLRPEEEMQFWTLDEYKSFIKTIESKPKAHMAFQLLYWCGLRVGELIALTRKDIDLENKILSVNKSRQHFKDLDLVTEPKTPKSKRKIVMPDFICDEIKKYMLMLYDTEPTAELFPGSKEFLYSVMRKGCKESGVKHIRIHDLRHSHASLLIELGFSPALIAERLGHESIQTTLDIYAHLYPNKQTELVQAIESLNMNM